MKQKLLFYKDNDKAVHVSCHGGRFYNGTILDINFVKGFLVLIDLKLGEIPIMFEEVLNIEPFRRDRK